MNLWHWTCTEHIQVFTCFSQNYQAMNTLRLYVYNQWVKDYVRVKISYIAVFYKQKKKKHFLYTIHQHKQF